VLIKKAIQELDVVPYTGPYGPVPSDQIRDVYEHLNRLMTKLEANRHGWGLTSGFDSWLWAKNQR